MLVIYGFSEKRVISAVEGCSMSIPVCNDDWYPCADPPALGQTALFP